MPGAATYRRPASGARRRVPSVLIALGVLLLLAGLLGPPALPAPVAQERAFATGGGGGGSAEVRTVNLTDAPSFTPNALTASSGDALALHLVNSGSYAHTFTLSKVANFSLNRSWTPTELDAWFAANGSFANVSLNGNASLWANFTLPSTADGSYEFASLVAYQFQAGMFGYLNVTSGSAAGGVSLTEHTASAGLRFDPAVLVANATAFPVTVSVAVSNLGSAAHTWTLVAQPEVNVTSGSFVSYFQSHPPAASVNVPSTPGQVVYANFTIAQKGVYQYICEIPGHLAAGMEGYLYIGVPAPASVAPPSTDVVQPWLLVGGGAILGVGVVLALAASLVGRIPPPAYRPPH
ncbi:MAG TPA: plastocyanin/azurin family copper-binding protein [Thermoplasmata archaeon]|nr:plastocyanin/azurin family copper-binding protein [Thermoplasmata archaeon]